MTTKITILLGILIVALAAANVYFYQKSAAMENTIAQLTETNKDLRDTISNNNQSSSIVSPPTGNATLTLPSNPPQISKSLPNGTSQSIAAVAVKAVPVTDGFFQSVKYEGTVMDITVDIREGRGLVLVNTGDPNGCRLSNISKDRSASSSVSDRRRSERAGCHLFDQIKG